MAKRSETPATDVTLAQARAHWADRQRLSVRSDSPLEALLAETGWVRTLGGADGYLALLARATQFSVAAVAEALTARDLAVSPAVRGCMYLVPRRDQPLALAIADAQGRKRADTELVRVGVAAEELAELCAAVAETLAKEPLDTNGIRARVPPALLRSLGAAGKAAGMTSALPHALRRLEFDGKVQRTPIGRRLDTERYLWGRVTDVAPFQGDPVAAILERVLDWAAPVRVEDVAAWTGFGKRQIEAAIVAAGAVPAAIEGFGTAYLRADDVVRLSDSSEGREQVALLPFEDGLYALHGGASTLAPARFADRLVAPWGMGAKTRLGDTVHLAERALVVGNEIRGLWEFDPDTRSVVLGPYEPLGAAAETAERERERVSAFLADDLGHGRSFALDTDDALRLRAAALTAP